MAAGLRGLAEPGLAAAGPFRGVPEAVVAALAGELPGRPIRAQSAVMAETMPEAPAAGLEVTRGSAVPARMEVEEAEAPMLKAAATAVPAPIGTVAMDRVAAAGEPEPGREIPQARAAFMVAAPAVTLIRVP